MRDGELAGHALWLSGDVRDELAAEADRHSPRESGGVLLGFEDPDRRGQVQVVSAIGPGPKASHKRHRFTPDGPWQQKQIETTYSDSGRRVSYLGDWHSHPRGGGSPSRRDRKTARKIARAPAARAPSPIMVIVSGGTAGEWSLSAYRYSQDELLTIGAIIR